MKNIFSISLLLCLLLNRCSVQETIVNVEFGNPTFELNPPKLMVGITVDQMRYDYLTKYWKDYSEEGFKKLIREGYTCKNHHFSYAPTYTGPGHASIYTGTTPAYHGIIGNNWYDKYEKSSKYCTGDSTVYGVGDSSLAGQMSPRNMLSSTITDELKLHSNGRSKTIGVSIKDRGAILPAGHLADAAYWFVGGDQGNFISSSYYMDELPDWVNTFNSSGYKDSLMLSGWNMLKPGESYDESIIDNNQYEAPFTGKLQPAFPYNFTQLADSNGGFDLIKGSPLGNSIVTEMAIKCLKNEALGQDEFTDFLAVSFSSTDYVGHRFAPAARETQDCYLRLDLEIARLISELDASVGKGNYTVFLTADHGAVHNPNYLKRLRMPSGYFKLDEVSSRVNAALKNSFGLEGLIESYSNDQLFFNDSLIAATKLDITKLEEIASKAALGYEGVYIALTRTQLVNTEFSSGLNQVLQNGFSTKYSGDVIIVPRPGWMNYPTTGTSHGSPFTYDTHVPLLFYGNGISPGFTDNRTHIKDIASTVASILGVQMPNANTGEPILEILGQ